MLVWLSGVGLSGGSVHTLRWDMVGQLAWGWTPASSGGRELSIRGPYL